MGDKDKYLEGLKRKLEQLRQQLAHDALYQPLKDQSKIYSEINGLNKKINDLSNFADPKRAAEMKSFESFSMPQFAHEFEKNKKELNFHKKQEGAMNLIKKANSKLVDAGIVSAGTGVGGTVAATTTTTTVAATTVGAKTVGGCIGLAILALSVSVSAEEEEIPHPKMTRYQIYLIEWIVYAVRTLRKNGGNFDAVRSVKTYRQWLKNPAI